MTARIRWKKKNFYIIEKSGKYKPCYRYRNSKMAHKVGNDKERIEGKNIRSQKNAAKRFHRGKWSNKNIGSLWGGGIERH